MSALEQEPEGAPESRSAKAKRVAQEGGKVLGVAALKVVSRALAWGALGGVLGAAVWNGLYWPGLLEMAWEPWAVLVWVLLVVYVLLGAGGLGYVGGWRGIGRTVLYVGVERGLVVALVDRVLDKLGELLGAARQSSARVDRVVDVSQRFVEDLPLQQWEERLKGAVQSVMAEDDGASKGVAGSIARKIRGLIVGKIEAYLLTIVRKEIDAQGGGGVSIEKVRALALAQSAVFFEDFITGLMNKKLLLGLGILAVVYAVAPLVAVWV